MTSILSRPFSSGQYESAEYGVTQTFNAVKYITLHEDEVNVAFRSYPSSSQGLNMRSNTRYFRIMPNSDGGYFDAGYVSGHGPCLYMLNTGLKWSIRDSGSWEALVVNNDQVYRTASSLRYKDVVQSLPDLSLAAIKDLFNAYRAKIFYWTSCPERGNTIGAIVEDFLEALTNEEARDFAEKYLIRYTKDNLPDNFSDYAWQSVYMMAERYLTGVN